MTPPAGPDAMERLVERFADKLDALAAEVSGMRATLDAHIRQQSERTANRDKRCDDHEERIRRIDTNGPDEIPALRTQIVELLQWKSKLFGIALGVAAVSGGTGAAVSRAIGQ